MIRKIRVPSDSSVLLVIRVRGEKDVKVIICREPTGSLSVCASISHLTSDSPSPFGPGLSASYPPSHPGGMFPSSFRSEGSPRSRAARRGKGKEGNSRKAFCEFLTNSCLVRFS